MAKTFDFNTLKKQYLTTTLPDEAKTTIMVGMPTKQLFDELTSLSSSLKTESDETVGELYSLVAKLMSRNKGGIKITREHLESCVDFEDLVAYVKSYLVFVRGIASTKN